MWVDPNQSVGMQPVYVMCRNDSVELIDGTTVSSGQLSGASNPFEEWCRSLEPNTHWISAYLPYDRDKAVFFAARAVAQNCNVHMQATIELPDVQLRQWEWRKVQGQ